MPSSTIPKFRIEPPLLNSATPWATTCEDLQGLYNSPYTGAITVRTSLLVGFPHDASIHQYTHFSSVTGSALSPRVTDQKTLRDDEKSSLNTLGYSPISLETYLGYIETAASGGSPNWKPRVTKPIIISVTGSADEVAQCYTRITDLQEKYSECLRLMMEINLSCPNIPDKPPPAYNAESLTIYLMALAKSRKNGVVLAGIKTPPYTYQDQFGGLISALKASISFDGGCPVSFITATNTLGSCLVLQSKDGTYVPALRSASGEGIGGMAGASLHPLSLGNVATIRRMLDENDELNHVAIIGVGGVSDGAGFARMRSVGAAAVAVGTALGQEGLSVFESISEQS